MQPIIKAPTGIQGLDDILDGGLPQGRPTLVCGGPGCGKTLLAMEFLCKGACHHDEPGLMVSFEETREDIATNFARSEFGFTKALADKTVHIESIPLDRNYSMEIGEFSLDGLLVRLERSIRASGAKRLALDSLHSLLEHFTDTAHLRFEYARIFRWIKEKGLTAIITSERSMDAPAGYGKEEYLSDCVIYMDHRISDQISKRRLRVVKYRGSTHGTDEYPFMIDVRGIVVVPITSLEFNDVAPTDFISSGIEGLDRMLAGKGWYRGSTILISGGPGTGKSTLAANFARVNCTADSRSLVLAFEESQGQIQRNMLSVGIDLESVIKNDLLRIQAIRPGRFGLEEHLARVHTIIDDFKPDTVALDPITGFAAIGSRLEIRAMLTRLIDYLKSRGINAILTSLTPDKDSLESAETEVSSVVDTWITIRFHRIAGERKRQILINKARGIDHAQTRGELVLSSSGLTVKPWCDSGEHATISRGRP